MRIHVPVGVPAPVGVLAPFDPEDFAGLFASAHALHTLFMRAAEHQLRTRRVAKIGGVGDELRAALAKIRALAENT